ncbi:OmpA family protein [Cytophagaceae bacterium DM2B3-1]|uniref:OmpA family protein n=1 Tax=Xanthocytophaga flava TaxID=3048013 RepID=A0ABT7CXQ8_9BACT|nr:OmpA family protein [Xanthocytophaga flavus]MDJ1467110.1 OmpA family protein [Xanthocytophaga flavus]MDJ1497394.1 OmpA family protein [Xanthocytophaga flavus]
MKSSKIFPILLLFLSATFAWGQKRSVSIDPKSYEIENLGDSVNSTYDELGPVMTPDGQTLYFAIDGRPDNLFGADESQEIWFCTKRPDGKWSKAKRMPLPFNLEQFNSVESVTPDGSTLIIRGAFKNGKYKGPGFSASNRTANGWSVPQQLEIEGFQEMNKGVFTNAVLANNGKFLILAFSEVKNSEASDLYVSTLKEDGKWSRPQSLGTDINTNVSEDTPFLAADGKTLYFSSDRPGGLGAHDIYIARREGDGWQKWSKPVNMGSSINTEEADTYYTMDATGEYAYLVADKNSKGGSDIVRVKLKEEFRPDPVVLVSGKVFNSKTRQPLDAMISYEVLPGGGELGVARSNATTGEYKIVLPYGKRYGFRAKAPGFISVSDNIDLSGLKAEANQTASLMDTTLRNVSVLENKEQFVVAATGNTNDAVLNSDDTPLLPATAKDTTVSVGKIISRDLYLVPIEKNVVVRLNNVFFDFDKIQLNDASYPELDRVAEFMVENPAITIEIAGHTDAMGTDEYNLKLSEGRVTSVKDYLTSRKGLDPGRIVVHGYGESVPLADNETEEGRAQNRRVEFKIIKN